MDIFWTFYLNHLSPLWGYFFKMYDGLLDGVEISQRDLVRISEN